MYAYMLIWFVHYFLKSLSKFYWPTKISEGDLKKKKKPVKSVSILKLSGKHKGSQQAWLINTCNRDPLV